jgi:hypothetical protein
MDLKRTVYKGVDWIHLAKDKKNVFEYSNDNIHVAYK